MFVAEDSLLIRDTSEVVMRAYALVSGIFFALVAVMHILRAVGRVQVVVADIQVPVWMSVPAAILTGILAVWAFRLGTRDGERG